MTVAPVSPRWWLPPVIFTSLLIAAMAVVWNASETAREVLAKAVMTIAGALATPFILESSIAIFGLVVVLVINQWRMQKEGDGWVYLAKTEPDADSVAAGAETPSKRLDSVVLPAAPDGETDLNARLAMVEGFLALGLKQEAAEHWNLLSATEQKDPRATDLQKKITA